MICYIIIGSIAKTGGTERAVVNLSKILDKIGYNVTILSLCTDVNNGSCYPLPLSVDIVHLQLQEIPNKLYLKLKWYMCLTDRLFRIVESNSIVIGTGHNINTILPFLRFKHNKVIGCEHIQKETIPVMSRLLMRIFYPRLDSLVVLSEKAKEKYLHYNNRLCVIPNTLPFTVNLSQNSTHKRIIMVGRIDKNKGYDRAIAIFEFVEKLNIGWQIDIYGDGEEKKNILKMLEKRDIRNVAIHYPVNDIENKYKSSDIMIMTSHSEAMPMVILEANACGVPVIAYSNEGTEEVIVDGETGFVITDGDINEFCTKLKSLLTDSALRYYMAKKAIKHSKKYAFPSISHKWQVLLQECV